MGLGLRRPNFRYLLLHDALSGLGEIFTRTLLMHQEEQMRREVYDVKGSPELTEEDSMNTCGFGAQETQHKFETP